MEGIKKKGAFRRFLEWLGTPEEEEIVDGELNVKAFEDEDIKIIEALKKSSKEIDSMGKTMFVDKAKKRAETLKEMRAEVKKPEMSRVEVDKDREEKEIEQE